MEPIIKETYNKESLNFLEKYFAYFSKEDRHIKDNNEQVISSALIYEKIRIQLEYQEEHLIFKNAIARILLRKYILSPAITPEGLVSDLLNELAWADYLNPEAISKNESSKLKKICGRYLIILNNLKSKTYKNYELHRTITSLMSCEIDEILNPEPEKAELVDYATDILLLGLNTRGAKMSAAETRMQVKVSVFTHLFKPDASLVRYQFLKNIYPSWKIASEEQSEKIGIHFDKYFEKVEDALNHKERIKIARYVKKKIAPFILIKDIPVSEKFDSSLALQDIDELINLAMNRYDALILSTRQKVWIGTIRALIFIFITKISLAFMLEIPFDRYLTGKIDFFSLGINIYLPTFLMLLAGTFVKSPSKRNREVVEVSLNNILKYGKIDESIFYLSMKNNYFLDTFFNIFYSFFSLGVLIGAVKVLLYLKFNILSIGLFFLFVSAVSFLAFRIRNMALELAMLQARDNVIVSVLEFVFLPFIKIGKYFSDRLTRSNPLILALDFLIEAPLKTIIKIVNSWLRFLRAKKEEIDF